MKKGTNLVFNVDVCKFNLTKVVLPLSNQSTSTSNQKIFSLALTTDWRMHETCNQKHIIDGRQLNVRHFTFYICRIVVLEINFNLPSQLWIQRSTVFENSRCGVHVKFNKFFYSKQISQETFLVRRKTVIKVEKRHSVGLNSNKLDTLNSRDL